MDNTMLYKDNPDWQDVVPIPQDDGPNPACPIAYSMDYRDVMDYFRAINKKQEMSVRAFQLTTDAIELNPANYTVWHYRRKILKNIEIDLKQELEYIGDMIDDNPKNYQVWYHRRAIVELIGDGSTEPAFTATILEIDAKNYHAWQHRHWAMEKYNLFGSLPNNGLGYVDILLLQDVRNNSAWTHRFFIVSKTTAFTTQVIADEVEYALTKLKDVRDNESAWNYIKGVCEYSPNGLLDFKQIKQLCLDVRGKHGHYNHALSTLLDIYELEAKKGDDSSKSAKAAQDLCTELISTDAIRAAYWSHRRVLLKL
eukprot:m.31264 g.31264  ORF g.31264 m.31264 type:complete len:311 (-) comp16429_c0_seq1:293-1225(-)